MAEVSLLRKVVNIKTVSKLNLINVFSQVNITFPTTFALIQGHCNTNHAFLTSTPVKVF